MRWADHAPDPGPAADVRPLDTSVSPDAALNVSDVLLRGDGDRTVFIVDGAPVSLSAIRGLTATIANDLTAVGVGPGDRVLLRFSDSPELAASLLAVFSLGAIAIPTFVQYGQQELRYRLEDAEVTVVLVEAPLQSAVSEAINGLRIPVLVIQPDSWRRDEKTGTDLRPVDTVADDIALILYTSGSTGHPKGTCHTHADMLAACDTYGAATLRLKTSDVIVGAAAMPFALGFALFFLYPLRFGCVALLEADKSPERCLELIQRHRPTLLVGVATYYSLLLRRLAERATAAFSCLRGCLTGGERVTEALAERWLSETGQSLTQFLGTTEMLACFVGGSPDVVWRREAIGPVVSGYELVVRHPETFEPLADRVEGILSVRGPTSTKYWRRPEKQRAAVRAGWNVVPDLVYAVDGQIHFVGRQDDVIKSAGFRISPTQVETVVEQHPAVVECACVGAPDPEGVRPEVIKVCVVLHEGYSPSSELQQDLQAFVKSNAPPYLYPRIVEFVEVLPRTASGKLQRSSLRE